MDEKQNFGTELGKMEADFRKAWNKDIFPLVQEIGLSFFNLSKPAKISVAGIFFSGYLILSGVMNCAGYLANRAAGRNPVYETDTFSEALREDGLTQEKAQPFIDNDVCTGTNEFICANTIDTLVRAGVPAELAARFKKIGITKANETVIFFQKNITPPQVAPFLDQKLCRQPDFFEIGAYIDANISAETVGHFQKISLTDTYDIKQLAQNKVSADQVQEYRKNGIKDISEIVTYGKAHIPLTVIVEYKKMGIHNPDDIVTLVEHKISMATIKDYSNAGITDVSTIAEYGGKGITPSILREFGERAIDSITRDLSGRNIPFERVLPYLQRTFCLPEDCFLELGDYIGAGITPEKVGEFKKAGINDNSDIIDYVKSGIPASDVVAYREIGVEYAWQIKGLLHAAISPSSARKGLRSGCSTTDMRFGNCRAIK